MVRERGRPHREEAIEGGESAQIPPRVVVRRATARDRLVRKVWKTGSGERRPDLDRLAQMAGLQEVAPDVGRELKRSESVRAVDRIVTLPYFLT